MRGQHWRQRELRGGRRRGRAEVECCSNGCSNGCRFADPQDAQRGAVGSDFDPCGIPNASCQRGGLPATLEAALAPHAADPRALFWGLQRAGRAGGGAAGARVRALPGARLHPNQGGCLHAWVEVEVEVEVSQPAQSSWWDEAPLPSSDTAVVHGEHHRAAKWATPPSRLRP